MAQCVGAGRQVTINKPENCNRRAGATCVSSQCVAGIPINLDRLGHDSFDGFGGFGGHAGGSHDFGGHYGGYQGGFGGAFGR